MTRSHSAAATPTAAWTAVSERCRQQLGEEEFRASVAAAGELDSGLEATDPIVEIDGDQGRASDGTSSPDAGPYDSQPWRLEDGACEAV